MSVYGKCQVLRLYFCLSYLWCGRRFNFYIFFLPQKNRGAGALQKGGGAELFFKLGVRETPGRFGGVFIAFYRGLRRLYI